MSHLFLSYSRRDDAYVDAIAATLKNGGYRVWIDRQGIGGGEQWRKEIVDAIRSANLMLLFLSPNSARSDNVRKELDLAETAKVRVLPVALAPTEIPDAMKYQLAGVQIVEVWQDYEGGLNTLLHNLARLGTGAQARPGTSYARPVVVMPPGGASAPDLSDLGGRSLLDKFSLGRFFGRKKE